MGTQWRLRRIRSSGASLVSSTTIQALGMFKLPAEQLCEEALVLRFFLLVPAAALGGGDPAHDLINVLAAAGPRCLTAFLTCHRTAHLLAPFLCLNCSISIPHGVLFCDGAFSSGDRMATIAMH